MYKAFLFLLILIPSFSSAQIITEVITDKGVYSYGESIEVTGRIINNSENDLVTYRGSSSLITMLTFSGISLAPGINTTDDRRDTLWPGQSIEFKWNLDTKSLGLPTFTGEQTIVTRMYSVKDSVKFEAPKYLGGEIYTYFNESIIDTSRAKEIGEEFNGELLSSDHPLYWWRVKSFQVDSLRSELLKMNGVLEVGIHKRGNVHPYEVLLVSREKEPTISGFELEQNYPNPFNPSTNISFSLEKAGVIDLSLFDMTGRKVKTIESKFMSAGRHTISLKANDIASGVYFYRLNTGKGILSKKLTIIK